MAISVASSQYSGAWNGSQSSVTWSHTVSGGNTMLIVFATVYNTGISVTAATYAGSNMTQGANLLAGDVRIYVYYVINPTSGTNNIVFSVSSATYLRVHSLLLNDAKQDTPNIIGSLYNSSGGPTWTRSVTTTATTALLLLGNRNADDLASYGANTTAIASGGAELRVMRSTNTVGSGSNSLVYTANGTRNDGYVMLGIEEDVIATSSIKTINGNLLTLGVG